MGALKPPFQHHKEYLQNAIWEIEAKKASTQKRRNKFQKRRVYFEVGYADVDLDDIEKMSLEQLEQLAGKCEKVIVIFMYSGYFNKYVKYPSWKWVLQ